MRFLTKLDSRFCLFYCHNPLIYLFPCRNIFFIKLFWISRNHFWNNIYYFLLFNCEWDSPLFYLIWLETSICSYILSWKFKDTTSNLIKSSNVRKALEKQLVRKSKWFHCFVDVSLRGFALSSTHDSNLLKIWFGKKRKFFFLFFTFTGRCFVLNRYVR